MQPPDFLPSATLDMLALRARFLAGARRFFDDRGYIEVDTPLLSADRVIDPHLEPFAVSHADAPTGWSPGSTVERQYLQTSTEFCMKRLLAAGAVAIYQLCHVFRAAERSERHNPEFTMLEWYRVGDTHLEQMAETEELICVLFSLAGQSLPRPFLRTTYQEAFERTLQIDPLRAPCSALYAVARRHGLEVPESLAMNDRDGWLNLLLAFLVEPRLGVDRPEFIFDYPASQGALARLRAGDPPVAERFELYLRGIELCNGYHELTDPGELKRRIACESLRRNEEGQPSLPTDSRLLAAMDHGLPPCAGNAVGFDRVLMLATGSRSIDQVLPFAWERA
ncbi:MAG: EF-P lysine aminoacylase EpmA [Planctomycetota bacterium]|nr:EF-P lysine aminoacylase EpmA [Planctomycetota bacterium]